VSRAPAGALNPGAGRLLLLLASRPRQQSRKIRLPRCFPVNSAVLASKALAARTQVVSARAPMDRVLAGAAGLAVWATLLCNAASLAYFLRGYVVEASRRRRRGCVARSGADDVALRPEDEDPDHAVALAPDAVLSLELCAPAHPSSLATPQH